MVIIPSLNAAFIHIPRTGGKALSRALVKAFPDAQWLQANMHEMHAPASVAAQYLQENPRLFSIIRNPFDIFDSHYRLLQWIHQNPGTATLELNAFVEEEYHRPFSEYIDRALRSTYLCREGGFWSHLCDVPTTVFRYEDRPYEAIERFLGCKLDVRFDHPTGGVRPQWDADSLAKIQKHCRLDLEKFGYTAPQPQRTDPICHIPFHQLLLFRDVAVPCCTGWLDPSRFIPLPPGEYNLDEIWNHPRIVQLREAILQGDWRFCQNCPLRQAPHFQTQVCWPHEQPRMTRKIEQAVISDSDLCNLYCVTCRDSHLSTDSSRAIKALERYGWHHLKQLWLSGHGDPFVIPADLHLLQTFGTGEDRPDVHLFTNGLLLPKYWSTLNARIVRVVMSVDAATKETYERVRRGGKWEDVIAALEYLRDLRVTQQIPRLQYQFVIMASNFREIPAFVEQSIKYGADLIGFGLLFRGMHMTDEWWRAEDVCNPSHPNHAELLEVLQHPLLNDPRVDASVIQPLVRSGVGS